MGTSFADFKNASETSFNACSIENLYCPGIDSIGALSAMFSSINNGRIRSSAESRVSCISFNVRKRLILTAGYISFDYY